MSTRSKQERLQEPLIAALLSEATHQAAAEKVGISLATLARWLRDEGFQAEYREARARVVDHAVARLQESTSAAVTTLREALTADRQSDRIKSALGILDRAIAARDLEDMARELDELRQQVAALELAQKQGGRR